MDSLPPALISLRLPLLLCSLGSRQYLLGFVSTSRPSSVPWTLRAPPSLWAPGTAAYNRTARGKLPAQWRAHGKRLVAKDRCCCQASCWGNASSGYICLCSQLPTAPPAGQQAQAGWVDQPLCVTIRLPLQVTHPLLPSTASLSSSSQDTELPGARAWPCPTCPQPSPFSLGSWPLATAVSKRGGVSTAFLPIGAQTSLSHWCPAVWGSFRVVGI